MKVYRVVWKTVKVGMYGSGLWTSAGCGCSLSNDNHPNPTWDIDSLPWQFEGKYLFGFSSIKQYKAWVSKSQWRKRMHELGGKLVELEVPRENVLRGKKQIAFLNKDYYVIAKHSPIAYG